MDDFPPERQPSSTGRAVVLDALRARGPATVPALAGELGLHPNTVRFHLTKLVQLGLAREDRGAPAGPGRPRLLYRATGPGGTGERADESIGEYQLLSHILTGYVAAHTDDPAAAARSAGRQWGHHLVDRPEPGRHPEDVRIIDRVSAMLDKLGFAPQARPSGEILLHRCPFRAVAEQHPGVICSVHLGLMEGAVDELGGSTEDAVLQPFVTPDLCVARLSTSDAVDAGNGNQGRPGSAPA
ncbi:MAG TPA: helix-turn-helix domain-containing protein [Micromonosporaceae bacterium]